MLIECYIYNFEYATDRFGGLTNDHFLTLSVIRLFPTFFPNSGYLTLFFAVGSPITSQIQLEQFQKHNKWRIKCIYLTSIQHFQHKWVIMVNFFNY